jgi:hypothetical protein
MITNNLLHCTKCQKQKKANEFYCEVIKDYLKICKSCLDRIKKERVRYTINGVYHKPYINQKKRNANNKIVYEYKSNRILKVNKYSYMSKLKEKLKNDDDYIDYNKNVGFIIKGTDNIIKN